MFVMKTLILLLWIYFPFSSSLNGLELKTEEKLRNEELRGLFPPFQGCSKEYSSFSPKKENKINSYVINLDLAPEDRWKQVVSDKKNELFDLLNSIKANCDALFGVEVFELIDKYLPYLGQSLSQEYYKEMLGISDALGIPVGEVTLFNVFYEFFSVCTSIIAQSESGDMYLARNLDFGLFLGWDFKNRTWSTTELLRPLVVQLDFEKNGEVVFSSVNFAGFIGILTGVKKNAFALTINERFTLNGGYVGLAEWILGRRDLKWIGVFTRDVLLEEESYASAQKRLSIEPLVAPVYFILAGPEPTQGCIITRDRDDSELYLLGEKHKNQKGDWYLVQTNYDHWKNPPFYDDRRNPAITCMDEGGNSNIEQTLKNVLSTRPVLNKLTTYMCLMEVKTGALSVQLQNCESPCWPW